MEKLPGMAPNGLPTFWTERIWIWRFFWRCQEGSWNAEIYCELLEQFLISIRKSLLLVYFGPRVESISEPLDRPGRPTDHKTCKDPSLEKFTSKWDPKTSPKYHTWDIKLAIGAPKILLWMVLFGELLLGLVSTLQTTAKSAFFEKPNVAETL